jgi:molybdenum cofactor sulfurtransferase
VQGATIAFNVQRPDGSLVGFEEVEEAADERQIYVRSGSLCNPGGVATYLEWSPAEMRAAYAGGHRCANPKQIVFGKATGVVRVSLGAMSVSADVTTFLDFLEEVYVDQFSVVDPKAADLASLHTAQEYDPSYPHSLSVRSASRASAGRASQVSITHSIPHAIHIPPSEYNPSAPATPTSRSFTGSKGADNWTDSTPAMPSSASAHEAQTGPSRSNSSKAPPFIPSDYTTHHRPWEGEPRKYTTAAEAEAKFREMEEAIAAANRNNKNSSSDKARRFGRGMVNLLRQKSNHSLASENGNRYDPPDK